MEKVFEIVIYSLGFIIRVALFLSLLPLAILRKAPEDHTILEPNFLANHKKLSL
jgi:hypothetical protein